jgi:Ca-activated chloride channel homolog
MKIEAALTYDTIRFDSDKDAHLVVTITAPTKDGEEARPPICVVPVVDISGSMNGAKLEYAKRSAIKLIDHLRPGDYCGLIAFESNVHVIIPPQVITGGVKEQLKAEVGKLHTIGGTNFAGGMLKAIELVNALDLPMGVINRIIMLTDGQANEGPATTPEAIIKLFSANSGRVTASAFGYGHGASQDFLGAFAEAAKGNYAFIRDPDGALTAFGKELGGLCSTYGTDLVLELNGLAGHSIESVISDVDAEEEEVGGEVTIKIPEILAEERRDLVLAVKLKAQKQAFPRPMNAFDVKLTFNTFTPDGKKEEKTDEAKAKVSFVKPGEEHIKPVAALDKIVGLAEVIHAQIEAEEKAKKGDYVAAAAVMHNAAVHVGSRGYANLAAAARHTAGSVSSNASYNANQGYLTSYRRGGTRGMGVSEIDEGALAFLSDAGVQLSNSSQTSTSNAFAGTGVPLTPQVAQGSVVQDFVQVTGAVVPNIGMGSFTVSGDVAGAIVGDGFALGGIPGGMSWVGPQPDITGGIGNGIVANPLIPQTDSSEALKHSVEKRSHKVKKSKSSARW